MNKNIKHPLNSPSSQRGYSIVELMVASVIGLVVLSGAVTVFSGNNSSQKLSTGMARVQETGRVAIDILSNDLRLTGYQGCTNGTIKPIVIASQAPTVNMPIEAIWGGEFNGTSFSPSVHPDLSVLTSNSSIKPRAGTDVIYVQHGSGRATMLSTSMTTSSGPISLRNNPDQLATNDLVMISDCANADIFRATSVTPSTAANDTTVSVGFSAAAGNQQSTLNNIYTVNGTNAVTNPMRVMRFEANAYFVADSGRKSKNGDTIYSLFLLDTTAATTPFQPVELVEGVENMQIMYGERLENGSLRYLGANDPSLNINNVVSIQVGVLVASAEAATNHTDDRTYLLANVKVGPPDSSQALKHSGGKKLRAPFNTTVQLRNRHL